MNISDLKPTEGSNKPKKRVGRGFGSGHGKTSCKGHKGQKARSGGSINPAFEGGQMPMQRRLPKRGFTNTFATVYAIVNLSDIERSGLSAVDPDSLRAKGVIKSLGDGLKILGGGELGRAVTVRAHAFSASAAEKIKKAGGSVEVI